MLRTFLFEAVAIVSEKGGVVDRLFQRMAIFAFGLPFLGEDDCFDACEVAMRLVELGKAFNQELREVYKTRLGEEYDEALLPKMEVQCAIHVTEVPRSSPDGESLHKCVCPSVAFCRHL